MRATSEHNSSPAPETAAGNTNRAAFRSGGIAVTIAGLTGATWFALELLPPVLGFDDTDNPAVSLGYLRQHPQFYSIAGITLFIMAIAIFVASFAVSDALAPRTSGITHRSLNALGLFAAAFIFMHGVLRESVGPLLYIDTVNSGWGNGNSTQRRARVDLACLHGTDPAGNAVVACTRRRAAGQVPSQPRAETCHSGKVNCAE